MVVVLMGWEVWGEGYIWCWDNRDAKVKQCPPKLFSDRVLLIFLKLEDGVPAVGQLQ